MLKTSHPIDHQNATRYLNPSVNDPNLASPMTPIGVQMENLGADLTNLHDALTRFEERFATVVQPETATGITGVGSQGGNPIPTAPMTEQLMGFNGGLAMAISRVNSLIARCDL